MSLQRTRCVEVERDGGVAVVTMDDGKANAIGLELEQELAAAIRDSSDHGEALVLAGRAGRFSGGYDMSTMMSGPGPAVDLMTRGAELLLQLLSYPRPVVAACTGHAVAAGAVVLLACDVRIGLEGPFKIGLNEVGIGLPLPSFVTTLASERLDPRRLIVATLGAEMFDPLGAMRAGYLDRVVTSDVVAAATEEAQRLGAFPVEAYRLTKESARRGLVDRLRVALGQDVELVASLLGG
jgi:enoyl-CoA hydratase